MNDSAIVVATRAETMADQAHQRLDGYNGQIRDLRDAQNLMRVEVVREIAGARAEAKSMFEEILRKLAREDGVEEGQTKTKLTFLNSGRFWFGIGVTVVTSSLALAAFTLLAKGHGG